MGFNRWWITAHMYGARNVAPVVHVYRPTVLVREDAVYLEWVRAAGFVHPDRGFVELGDAAGAPWLTLPPVWPGFAYNPLTGGRLNIREIFAGFPDVARDFVKSCDKLLGLGALLVERTIMRRLMALGMAPRMNGLTRPPNDIVVEFPIPMLERITVVSGDVLPVADGFRDDTVFRARIAVDTLGRAWLEAEGGAMCLPVGKHMVPMMVPQANGDRLFPLVDTPAMVNEWVLEAGAATHDDLFVVRWRALVAEAWSSMLRLFEAALENVAAMGHEARAMEPRPYWQRNEIAVPAPRMIQIDRRPDGQEQRDIDMLRSLGYRVVRDSDNLVTLEYYDQGVSK